MFKKNGIFIIITFSWSLCAMERIDGHVDTFMFLVKNAQDQDLINRQIAEGGIGVDVGDRLLAVMTVCSDATHGGDQLCERVFRKIKNYSASLKTIIEGTQENHTQRVATLETVKKIRLLVFNAYQEAQKKGLISSIDISIARELIDFLQSNPTENEVVEYIKNGYLGEEMARELRAFDAVSSSTQGALAYSAMQRQIQSYTGFLNMAVHNPDANEAYKLHAALIAIKRVCFIMYEEYKKLQKEGVIALVDKEQVENFMYLVQNTDDLDLIMRQIMQGSLGIVVGEELKVIINFAKHSGQFYDMYQGVRDAIWKNIDALRHVLLLQYKEKREEDSVSLTAQVIEKIIGQVHDLYAYYVTSYGFVGFAEASHCR